MLRVVCAARLLPKSLASAGGRCLAAFGTSAHWSKYQDEHILVTDTLGQGHLMEQLEDPGEVERVLRHMRAQSTFGDTMADTIARETLEARKADLEARMAAKDNKELCEHGHVHDFCCGASKGEVEGAE